MQRKLNEMQKIDKPNTLGHIGQIGHKPNIDLEETESLELNRISESKAWVSSSARIEHQPPKLGVEGSNPSPPATKLEIELDLRLLWSRAFEIT